MSKLSALRSTRFRTLAVIGAVAIALGLSPVTAAAAAPSDPGTVHGAVTNAVTGDGIADVWVSVAPSDYSFSVDVTTDATGAYQIGELAPGDYYLSVGTFGLPYGMQPSQPFTISAAQPDVVLNVALEPYASGTSSISGVVRDAVGGEPVPNASLSIQGLDVVYYGGGSADADGVFTLTGLGAGSYIVSANAPGFSSSWSEVAVGDDDAVTHNIGLYRQDAAIAGRVTDENGVGISGMWVNASSLYGIGAAQTDSQGRYTISGLTPTEHTLFTGGNYTPWSFTSLTVTPASGSTTTLDFTLTPRTTSSIMGLVFDEGYGQVPNICIDLLDAASGAVVASTIVGSDSTYYFEDVANGSYAVRFEDCDETRVPQFGSTYLGGATLAEATIVTIEHAADDVQVAEVHLVPAAVVGSLALSVVDAKSGKAVTKELKAVLVGPDGVRTTLTDDDKNGALAAAGLALGEYTLVITAAGYEKQQVAVELTGEQPDVTSTVRLGKPGAGNGGNPGNPGHDNPGKCKGKGKPQHGPGHGDGHGNGHGNGHGSNHGSSGHGHGHGKGHASGHNSHRGR